jgi:Domain of unknown function (DUF4410)
VRLDAPAPVEVNALMIEGNFEKIDEGSRRRRMLVGLGAGKSEIGASVQIVYQPANGSPTLLQGFSANADSGHMPGIAETAGVGAVAGHLAVSAAAGAGVHGVSETKHAGMSAEAKKLADSIAKQFAAANAANGWMPVVRSVD